MGGGQKGRKKIRACWYGLSKNTDACAVAHYEVRLPELVLWHGTLSDVVGRPLPRVLCVIIGGVIIWAGDAFGDRLVAQLHAAAT